MTRLAAATLALLVASSCFEAERGTGGPEPAVPAPALEEMEPPVARALGRARQAVLDTGSAEAWGELGALYDAHGLTADAETCYRRAMEADPERFDWVYLHAVVREIRGADTGEVVAGFERAAAMRRDYTPIYVRLGAALALRGEHERARDAFVTAIELAPGHAVAHRGLGQALLALGQPEAAVARLERAVELEPRDLAARSGLAQAYMRLGRTEQARRILEGSRGLEPINAVEDPVYGARVFMRSLSSSRAFARAQAALRIGRSDQAARDLDIVLQARPDDASAHYWKGLAHARMSETGPALDHLSRAVELEPGMTQARLQLALTLVGQGRFAEALDQCDAAARLRPLNANGHYVRGQAYEGLGRHAEARRDYEAAVELEPQHPARQRIR